MEGSFCWTLYEARNFMLWGDITELLMRLLPLVVFLVMGWRAFRWREAPNIWIKWRDLRGPILLLIPWAVAQILQAVFMSFCYSA